MYCKDCVFRVEGRCTNPHLTDDHYNKDFDQTTSLKYSFDEGGWFEVGDYFGCVHFKQRTHAEK